MITLKVTVRQVGVEPTRLFRHRFLRPACLPFHHWRISSNTVYRRCATPGMVHSSSVRGGDRTRTPFSTTSSTLRVYLIPPPGQVWLLVRSTPLARRYFTTLPCRSFGVATLGFEPRNSERTVLQTAAFVHFAISPCAALHTPVSNWTDPTSS